MVLRQVDTGVWFSFSCGTSCEVVSLGNRLSASERHAEVRGVVSIGKIPGSMELGRIEGLIIQAGTIDRI